MTDASHQAHKTAKRTADTIKKRIIAIVRDNPGIHYHAIQEEYQRRHGEKLSQATAGGRISELAKAGIIYVNGSGRVGNSTLSRYYYEPDPDCRFRIRMGKENEAFLKWITKADEFADRLPGIVLSWLRDRKALLSDTMKMVSENREG